MFDLAAQGKVIDRDLQGLNPDDEFYLAAYDLQLISLDVRHA